MRIFLTGANGWVGSAIVAELLEAGHSVVGLVRSSDKGAALAAAGGEPLVGSVGDINVLRQGAGDADGIIHTAFGLDHAKIVELSAEDARAIETFGDVFTGSGRPIVVTAGFGVSPSGPMFVEADRPGIMPDFPRASEQTAFALAERGLNAAVVRLPRSVHAVGETHGFIPMLTAVARDKGLSVYVGDGQNRWPSVHRLDAARLFRLAVEQKARNEAFHAVAEEGVAFKAIAEAIGWQVGVPVRSLTPDEAEAHFGALAMWVAGDGPASSAKTRQMLGWEPQQVGLIADIDRPEYHG